MYLHLSFLCMLQQCIFTSLSKSFRKIFDSTRPYSIRLCLILHLVLNSPYNTYSRPFLSLLMRMSYQALPKALLMSSYVLTNVKLCDIYYLSSFPPLLPSSAKQVCLWPQEIRLVLQDWKFMNIYLLFQLKKKKFVFLSLVYFQEIICSVTVRGFTN